MTFDASKQYPDFKDLLVDLNDEEKQAIADIPTDYRILNQEPDEYLKITEQAKLKYYVNAKQNNTLTDDKYQHFENLFAYFVKLQRLKRTAHLVRLEKSKYYKTINSHGPFVQATLKDYIGEVVSDSPIFVIADHKDRQIKEARVTTFLNPETKEKWQGVQFGDVIIDAYPEKIIVFTDPLEQLTKYSINFITNKGTSIVLGPLVLSDMVKELLEKTSLVYKPRVLKERLNAIINAYIAHKKVEYKIEIEREGFFWIDGELKMSKVACMEEKPQTTQDEVKDALQFIFEVKESFSLTPTQIERLAHEIKWALAAPYDFARRQAGIATKSNNFLPRMDKHGEPDSGKTNGPKYMVLGIYGLAYDDEYVQPYGACDTQPRFINKTGRSTMPIIIDEADELTHWNKDRHAERMLSLLKNQTTMTAPRTILTKESDEITGYSLSPYILTHNSDRIDEDGFLKRVTSMGYTSADKKSKIQIKQFEEYMEKNIHRYVALGRFAINHVMQNQGLLRDRWNIMAEEILDSSFEFAKIERPAWLSTMVTNTSKEDLQDYRRGLVRQLLVNMINDNYIRHRHNIESMISDLGTVDQTDMISKFQALLSVHTLPDFHQKKNGDLLIFTSIKTHLEKVGLDRVSSIKAFAELCGFTYSEQNKINGRNIPAALVSLTDFAAFLAIRLEEPSTDGGQSTLTATPPVV